MFLEEGKRLVIAFDAKRLFLNTTGLGNYSRTLVKNLQAYYPEHDYHLFTPRLKKNRETEYFFDTSKFTIHTPKAINPLWRTFGIANDVNKLNPDIYHGLSHELPFGLDSKIVKVVTFHDLIYEIYPHQFPLWDRWMYKWKYKSAAKRAHHIIAISEATKQDLIQLYTLDNSKITVIYQSCQEEFQNIETEPVPFDNISIPNQPYYLYVGSIIERKGLAQVVIAYAQLPPIYRKKVIVVGNGDKVYVKKVKDLIQYYGLEQEFLFLSSIPNHALIYLYDHSYCLLLPSIYEGFGIPIIESLFRQKPAITGRYSALPEAGGPGVITVDPLDPADICDALIAINNPTKYGQLVNYGWQHVVSNFSSEATATQLLRFYHSSTQNEE